jgi:hypothetical protein
MPLFKKKKVISTMTPLVISETKQENGLHIPSSTNVIDPPKQNFRQQCCSKENLKEQALLIATVASVIISIGVGIGLRSLKCPTGKK